MIQFFTAVESGAWLATHFGAESVPTVSTPSITFTIPADAGAKIALARALMALITPEDEHSSSMGKAALIVTAHGIWPSSENIHLFNQYRKALGEQRFVDDAPGHIFQVADPSDQANAEGLLDLVLYFFWDALLANPDRKLMVKLSHDEWLSVFSPDAAVLEDANALLLPICGEPK